MCINAFCATWGYRLWHREGFLCLPKSLLSCYGTVVQLDNITIDQVWRQLTWKNLSAILFAITSIAVLIFWAGYYYAETGYKPVVAEKERQIQNYSAKWASIEPHLYMNRFFDIEKHVVSIHSNDIPATSDLINGDFVAPTNVPGLTYGKMKYNDYRSLFGLKLSSGCESVMTELAPLHVWRTSRALKLKKDGEETTSFAHIVFQKISKPRLQNKLLELSRCWHENEKSNVRITESGYKRLGEVARNINQLDIVGLYYAFLQISYLYRAVFDSNFEWTVTNVQKQKQVLHAGNFFTFKKVRVMEDSGAERSSDAFYMREQIIMVEVPQYIYFIQITVPSLQVTRDLKFDELSNQWLSGLRMFYE